MKRNLKRLAAVFSRAVHERSIREKTPLSESAIAEADIFGIDHAEVPKYLTLQLLDLFKLEAIRLKQIKQAFRETGLPEF